MSVVSFNPALRSLGPKHGDNDDYEMTNNELLPGFNVDSKPDPEVKGS